MTMLDGRKASLTISKIGEDANVKPVVGITGIDPQPSVTQHDTTEVGQSWSSMQNVLNSMSLSLEGNARETLGASEIDLLLLYNETFYGGKSLTLSWTDGRYTYRGEFIIESQSASITPDSLTTQSLSLKNVGEVTFTANA